MGDSDDGIVARSLDYLFKQVARRSGSDGCRYTLRVSFAEIYNEQIYDLIRFDKKPLQVGRLASPGGAMCMPLAAAQRYLLPMMQVRWDATAGFHAPDLLKQECTSLEQALRVGANPA